MSYKDTKQKAEKATQLLEMMDDLDCFNKQDVVSLLHMMVEVEVRRYMMTKKKD